MKKYLLLILMLTSCQGVQLPKYGKLEKLRVLALKATSPEVSPGANIPVVSALVYDPDNRPITYEWYGCSEALTTDPKRFDCDLASDKISLGTGTSSSGTSTISTTYLLGQSTIKKFNGINYIVSVIISAGTDSVRAFKRITVSDSTKTTKNSNPTLNYLTRENVQLNNNDSVGSTASTLLLNVSAGSYESFTYLDSQGVSKSSTEDLLLTWFYSEGEMYQDRTFGGNLQNIWTPPNPKVRANVTLSVVAHDERGGTDWVTITLQ